MDLNEAADALLRLEQPQQQGQQNETNEEENSESPSEEKQEGLLDTEEPNEAEQEESNKIKIEFDGKELEVDQDELLKGYKEYLKGTNRQEHLTKRFQEAAEQRQQAEAARQQFEQSLPLITEYKQRLDILNQVLETPPVTAEHLNQLLEDGDTTGYLREKEKLEQWQTRKTAILQQQNEVQRLLREAQLRKVAELQKQEQELLYKSYPELSKEENAAKLTQYLLSYGYSTNDLQNVLDHRNFIIADKARRFDELQAKAKDVKKVPNTPKVIKKGASPTVGDYSSEKYKKAYGQLKRTGSIHDAVEALLAKQKI